jgi:hypothetical protein
MSMSPTLQGGSVSSICIPRRRFLIIDCPELPYSTKGWVLVDVTDLAVTLITTRIEWTLRQNVSSGKYIFAYQ